MDTRTIVLVVLVLGIVGLAIYLAMRPSQSVSTQLGGTSTPGSSRAGSAVSSVGQTATQFASSIADLAG